MAESFIRLIQITSLAEGEPFFIQLKLLFASGETKHLKIQLDKYTYTHLRKIVFPSYLNNTINNAKCFIPVSSPKNNKQTGEEWIVWDILGQTKKLSFLSSDKYRIFINKIRNVSDEEEFNKIIPSVDEKKTEEKKDAEPKSSHRLISKYICTTLVIAFCLFASSSANLFVYAPDDLKISEGPKIAMAETEPFNPGPLIAGSEKPEEHNDNPSDAGVESKELILKDIIRSLPDGQVALTFDDGPSVYTEDILRVLEEYGVKATFFFIGKNIYRYPEAVQAVRDQGHGIGLHSFSHKVLRDLSKEDQTKEIESCLEAIAPMVDRDEIFLFRPPYGMFNDDTKELLSKHQMSLVLWNRDPRDWAARSDQEILSGVLNTTYSGGIYLLHENALTLEALPQIIEAFQEEDLEFINLGKKDNLFTAITLSIAQVENKI